MGCESEPVSDDAIDEELGGQARSMQGRPRQNTVITKAMGVA